MYLIVLAVSSKTTWNVAFGAFARTRGTVTNHLTTNFLFGALPVSAKRCADRVNSSLAGELAEHDAAVDEIYQQLIAKASKTSPAKSKRAVHAEEF